jgi:hypothetical protein
MSGSSILNHALRAAMATTSDTRLHIRAVLVDAGNANGVASDDALLPNVLQASQMIGARNDYGVRQMRRYQGCSW